LKTGKQTESAEPWSQLRCNPRDLRIYTGRPYNSLQ